MINFFWRWFAKLLAHPTIAAWIIDFAQRTPYQHIMSKDGNEMYMGRWWLFNPYDRETHKPKHRWFPWSLRIHHIMVPDSDRDLHDHPWNARTVILFGGYTEQRLLDHEDPALRGLNVPHGAQATEYIDRNPGDTTTLKHGEYHRIDRLLDTDTGAFTLFITSNWQGEWGFLVNGVKVHWKKYTGEES